MAKIKFSKILIFFLIIFGTSICGTMCQERNAHHSPETSSPSERRRQQAISRSQPACDYKDALHTVHDRINALVTVEQNERSQLESISEKIAQLELSNRAILESLTSGQMDVQKRLDNSIAMQHSTRRDLETLRNSLSQNITSKMEKDISRIINDLNNEITAHRQVRQIVPTMQQDLSESEKLDALSTLLVSTRAALNTLQVSIEGDVSRLLQETNRLNHRLTNLQRRQQQQQQQQSHHGGIINYIPTQTSNYSPQLITSCSQGAPTTHGILRLQLTEKSDPFYVRCDDDYMNGGWTIIQNRYTGDLSFQRDWTEYKNGFGNLASEFFIGLDKLHAITSNAVQELIIVLEDFNDQQRYARYNLFAIGDESEYYALKLLGDYEGDAGDALTYHAGSKFSTFDNDNDGCVSCNCAESHLGAWWYNWCEQSNLNGKYYKENATVPRYTGIYWHHFQGPNVSLRATRMMIRPVVLEQESRR